MLLNGGGYGTRTHMPIMAVDFESTVSAIPPTHHISFSDNIDAIWFIKSNQMIVALVEKHRLYSTPKHCKLVCVATPILPRL